jgi:hypothetical protein
MEMLSFGGRYYLDDRMFVVHVEPVTHDDPAGDEAVAGWAVTTRRNVPGYAVVRRSLFETRERAIGVLRKLAPQTPRLSLHGLSPVPAPTFEQHNAWLREQGLAPLEY